MVVESQIAVEFWIEGNVARGSLEKIEYGDRIAWMATVTSAPDQDSRQRVMRSIIENLEVKAKGLLNGLDYILQPDGQWIELEGGIST